MPPYDQPHGWPMHGDAHAARSGGGGAYYYGGGAAYGGAAHGGVHGGGAGYRDPDYGHPEYHDAGRIHESGYYDSRERHAHHPGYDGGHSHDNGHDYDTRPWPARHAGFAGAGAGAGAAGCYGIGCTIEGPPRLSFVGVGAGDYVQELRYVYVGEGAGDFEPSQVKISNPCAVWGGCGFASVVVLIVVLWLIIPAFSPTTTSTTTMTGSLSPFDCSGRPIGWSAAKRAYCCNTEGKGCATSTEAPPADIKSCLIWGDPHIRTFDGGRPDFYGEGEVWIIKSSDVYIQARYRATPFTNGLAATETLAIGGPFLHGHVFKVGPLETGSITWDGQPVLTTFPSRFSPEGLGTITYNGEGELVDNAMIDLKKFIVHIDFPQHLLHIQVMRWSHHVNVRITSPLLPGGMDGHCGNFNHNPMDDSTEAILARMGTNIPPEENLFRTPMPYHDGHPHNINECEPSRRELARQKCQMARPGIEARELEACTFDVCFGGTRYALQDAVY